jgi:glycosyltransferase involved in cell wall biosynthesis
MLFKPTISIVITTRNRREELLRALRSAEQQNPEEIIVVDDGSVDGTSNMVRLRFPDVVLVRHEVSKGLVVRRNEAAKIAKGEVIVSIDDDAAFSTPRVVDNCLPFLRNVEVIAVAIPYVDVYKSDSVKQLAPSTEDMWVISKFIGTAHAIKREAFLEIGGYRDYIVHQGEESDLGIRLLAKGQLIVLGVGDPIFHYESPRRDLKRMDYYGARNSILFVLEHVPMPFVILRFARALSGVLAVSLNTNRLAIRVRGAVDAFAVARDVGRHPFPMDVYRRFRLLEKHGPMKLSEFARPQ